MAPNQLRSLPSHGVMYAGFFLNGAGVVLLGPLLPRLGHSWGFSDSQQGALLAAQFLGSALGTILVFSRRRIAILTGSFSSWLGMSAVALLLTVPAGTRDLPAVACLSLLVYGFGLGQVITTLNLAVGKLAPGRAGRLSFANALWSLGAILSPLILAASLHALPPVHFLLGLAAASPLFALLWEISNSMPAPTLPRNIEPLPVTAGVSSSGLLIFASLLLLYGGAETCFSGWLTTFALRSSSAGETASTLCTSAFWFGVAAGRALGAGMLRRYPERQAMYFLLTGASICGLGLLLSASTFTLSLWAAACGALLGPVFPAALAALLALRPSPRQCGFALAACGIGASAMPLLLSVISQQTSSLRLALLLPSLCLLLMLVLLRGLPRAAARESLVEA